MLASTQARSELDLLREPLSAAARLVSEQMVLSRYPGARLCPGRERPSTSLRERFLAFKREASTSCKCQKQLEGREHRKSDRRDTCSPPYTMLA